MTVIDVSDSEPPSAPETWLYTPAVGLLAVTLLCARLAFA